jgi:hypothetical protein
MTTQQNTHYADTRRQDRLVANRTSAARSRHKKSEEVLEMQARLEQHGATLHELAAQMGRLHAENERLAEENQRLHSDRDVLAVQELVEELLRLRVENTRICAELEAYKALPAFTETAGICAYLSD